MLYLRTVFVQCGGHFINADRCFTLWRVIAQTGVRVGDGGPFQRGVRGVVLQPDVQEPALPGGEQFGVYYEVRSLNRARLGSKQLHFKFKFRKSTVKVEKDWTKNFWILKRLGYAG